MSNFFGWSSIFGMICLGSILTVSAGYGQSHQPTPTGKYASIVFFPEKQKSIEVKVEIAQTDEDKARGLMYRETLAPFSGMLFSFFPPQKVHFWMKNTYIPLDLIFLDENLGIVAIEENMIPLDETSKGPKALVQYVVEVNGGFCKRYHIQLGTKVKLNKE